MIKNIVFDIGNVLTDFCWREFLKKKGCDEATIERIAAASVNSPDWAEYDRGILTDEEIMSRFVRNDPGVEKEMREAFADFGGLVEKREYVIPWLESLREQGYRLFYLSNFSRKAGEECKKALDFLPYMDGGILSYREKMIKPCPEIYQHLAKRYALVPSETVFIDDMGPNVWAAKKEGWHAILFMNKEQVEEDLNRLLMQS